MISNSCNFILLLLPIKPPPISPAIITPSRHRHAKGIVIHRKSYLCLVVRKGAVGVLRQAAVANRGENVTEVVYRLAWVRAVHGTKLRIF